MDVTDQVWISWSGGKDSLMALKAVFEDSTLVCAGLVTSIREHDERVPVHGTSKDLLRAQSESLKLPHRFVRLPDQASNAEYEEAWRALFSDMRKEGISSIAYGDIYLADIRQFRERLHRGSGIKALFPLWRKDPGTICKEFTASGNRSIIVSVDPASSNTALLGKEYDWRHIKRQYPAIDPCGERGEFHTFVHHSPFFRKQISVEVRQTRMESGRFMVSELRLKDPE